MPLRTLLRLRRRRAEADLVWRLATRREDIERIRREADRTQTSARAEAFQRIIEQGQRRHAS